MTISLVGLVASVAALAACGGGDIEFGFEAGAPKGMCHFGMDAAASGERTPDGAATYAFVKRESPAADAVAHSCGIRFNAECAPEPGRPHCLTFWAKADRDVTLVCAIAQAQSPYRTFQGKQLAFSAGAWRRCEIVWDVAEKESVRNTYSLPFFLTGLLEKGTTLTVGPIRFGPFPVETRVRGADWRPLKLDAPEPEYFKPKEIPGYKVKAGSVLDLAQYLPRYDIDRMGRIVADEKGDLRFANAPGELVRLRGFNCTYGGAWDGFERNTDAQMDELADQIVRYGLNVLRFHFFDGKFAGKSGMAFFPVRDKDVSECEIPQTYEDLLKTIDRKFLDRFQYFTAALRKRGVYYMIDVFTSNTMFVKAGKNKASLNMQLFLDERVRNHWKAAYDFLMLTPNPYTGMRPIADPQLFAITCRNEQEHVFGGNGGNTDRLVDFTPRFRAAYGADMPEFSYALLHEATPVGDKARAFVRHEIAELNRFFLDKVRASGWKGLVTHWDMSMRNLEGDARQAFNAVAIHPYHAHPGTAPLPAGEPAPSVLEPWNTKTMETVSRASSIGYNNYIARSAVTRVLGKPLLVTEISHCGANRFCQEEPVVLTAGAALQDWQLVTPHADLVDRLVYGTFSPACFDSGMSPMARITSLAAAFGWQRGDIAAAKHAVSIHVPESVLGSKAYVGAIGSSHNALAFVTRVGGDYGRAHNPLADLDLVPETYTGVAMKGMWAELNEQVRINDAHRAAQFGKLRAAGMLGADNITDPDRGLYQSDTGEIVTDVGRRTMTVDAPRFQAAALKPESGAARLSALAVESVSVPASVLAISLDAKRPVAESERLLVVVATSFVAENSRWTRAGWQGDCDALLREGGYSTLMRAGRFRFSVRTALKSARVYAVNFDGSRECEIPVRVSDGRLVFELDTSALEWGTPYFEVDGNITKGN